MKKLSPSRRVTPHLLILLVLVFALINQSCQDNFESENASQSPQSATARTENTMLSYNDFLKQIEGFKDKELYDHFRSNAEAGLRTAEEPLLDFRVRPSTTDSVRRISVNNHTTYTIPVYRRSHTGEVFRNIIIDSTDTGVKAYLAWYFPDKNWIREYRKDRKRSFYGTVIMNNYDDLPSSGRPGGRVDQQPVCASVMVLSEIVEHLCCHNAQHASCNCPNGSKYSFEFLYNIVTTCIDAYIPPSGGMPGGGGTGGGTIPNPGGGYDPCNGGGLRTSTTPCNPNPQNPGPVVTANATVAPLISIASSKGINFTSTEIAILNSQDITMVTRIKDLISTFGNAVKTDYNNLMMVLTGRGLSPLEDQGLDALGDNIASYKFTMRLMYAANAYAAQTSTALMFNYCGSTCATCKANAFKHALFLIFNAKTFTQKSAETLAGAHESGQAGLDSKMDKENNAAGSAIFSHFNGSGTTEQWVSRVKTATDLGQQGLVFIKGNALISTKEADSTCP
ncbi:DUF6973 domain-containing protein [Dyadobacter luticola]|uniref:DUF6973 domain-containing protein n=1 Tax=Dyadobacter luticola TaxID=1979387 RepID=A0A5R9KVG9_9BACT|nr:hypothetical protein [Dyadobacter luticola]TLV00145.1 hypothetical protein FEN17_11595 [Dyadobacter luticola]